MDFTGLSKLACGFQLYVHSFLSFLRFDLVMMPICGLEHVFVCCNLFINICVSHF